MSPGEFSVTKSCGELIKPCESTPSGTLPLSSIDRIYIKGLFIGSLHVFKQGKEPAKLIREALSKALVPYYPLAGRLVEHEKDGQLQVSCTGDGLWFVEGTADCTLEDVDWLENEPIMIPHDQLVPLPPQDDGIMVIIQVTEFKCGGFVFGFKSDHIIADGLGVAQFMNAVADMARGLNEPIVTPVWCRHALPDPPKLDSGPLPPLPTSLNQYLSLDISLDRINQLKKQFLDQTGKRCSTFDILCANIWQCRARAINLGPESEVRLVFSADARQLLKQVLPAGGGYYGNCIYPVPVISQCGKVANAGMAELVSLIREAKERFPVEFDKWAKGELKEDPFRAGFGYHTLYMTDWARLGVCEVDYGSGCPKFFFPLISNAISSVAFLLKPPAPKEGLRLVLQCVVEEHMGVFRDEMGKFVAE